MRGSVPGHWSQDVSKMVPKPTIACDLADPYVETAGEGREIFTKNIFVCIIR